MKHLDFRVTREFEPAISDAPLTPNETVTIELPDDVTLSVVVKMLHSNDHKATAYNVERRICAFLEVNSDRKWVCTSLFHVPPMPNEPAPQITIIHMHTHPNADPRPQSDQPAV